MLFYLDACEDPGTPVKGGKIFTDGLMEDSVVTYICNDGYQLSGTPMQTCVLSETEGPVWRNESLPTCICKRTKCIQYAELFCANCCNQLYAS